MAITLASNFDETAAVPLDSRYTRADTTARDAIPSGIRFKGLQVFTLADEKLWVLKTGITNGDWVEAGSGSTPAIGKLITLNPGGLVTTGDLCGIQVEEASSLTGYIKTAADRLSWIMKPPGNGGIFKFLAASGNFNSIFAATATADRTYTLPDRSLILGNVISTFTGTAVSPTASADRESHTYTGTSPQTFTGFGTLTSLAPGYQGTITGTSDTNTLLIQNNDTSNGWLCNGDIELGYGHVAFFQYNSTLARVVISRGA